MRTHRNDVSGNLQKRPRAHGHMWIIKWKYRAPVDGDRSRLAWRSMTETLAPVYDGKGRRQEGALSRKEAEKAAAAFLAEKGRMARPAGLEVGVTFEQAAREWITWCETERALKPSTLQDYKSVVAIHLIPAFGDMSLDAVTPDHVERWRTQLVKSGRSLRTAHKITGTLFAVYKLAARRYGVENPVAPLDRIRVRSSGEIEVYSVEEVHALVRAAADEQDAALYLTAALTGLRQGELVALRWRDVDFAGSYIRVSRNYTAGVATTPKSGKVRSVPLAPEVASALAQLIKRARFVGDDDLVFAGITGSYVDASALLRRYKQSIKRAGIRPLRFHDLRHTFGTRMIAQADILRVKSWMGHADVATTMKYLHYAPRPDDAALVAAAFALEPTAV